MTKMESTATKWGAFAGITTFLLLTPLAIINNNQAAWGIIGAIAAGAGIFVTLIGKWWERGWNTRIAEAETKKVDIERERLNIEKIRLVAELCERGVISKDFAEKILEKMLRKLLE